MRRWGVSLSRPNVSYGSRLCENANRFGSVTRPWLLKAGFPDLGIFAAGAGLGAGFRDRCFDVVGLGRKSTPMGAYAALIAAINGPMPMIAMTRLIL